MPNCEVCLWVQNPYKTGFWECVNENRMVDGEYGALNDPNCKYFEYRYVNQSCYNCLWLARSEPETNKYWCYNPALTWMCDKALLIENPKEGCEYWDVQTLDCGTSGRQN